MSIVDLRERLVTMGENLENLDNSLIHYYSEDNYEEDEGQITTTEYDILIYISGIKQCYANFTKNYVKWFSDETKIFEYCGQHKLTENEFNETLNTACGSIEFHINKIAKTLEIKI